MPKETRGMCIGKGLGIKGKKRKRETAKKSKVSVEGGIESVGNDVPCLFQNASQIQVRLVGGGAITSRPTIYINK